MDRSLAKAFANRYLDQVTPLEALLPWKAGVKVLCMARPFGEALRMRAPDHLTRRLRPILEPVFPAPRVLSWDERRGYEILTRKLSSAPASSVLHPDDPERTLFDERSVFLNQVRLYQPPHAPGVKARGVVSCGTIAGIGEHAIRRLLERDLASAEALPGAVETLLSQVSGLRKALEESDLDQERAWSLLLPTAGGAAIAVTHRVKTWPGMPPSRVRRIASVRTVLREDMLSPDQQDRLSGCHDPLALKASDPAAFAGWLRRNARPWDRQVVREVDDEPRCEAPSPF